MPETPLQGHFVLAYEDLQIVAEVMALRFSFRPGDVERVALARKLLETGSDLNYALSTYLHRASVQCRGSSNVASLFEDTVTLQNAFDAFGTQLRQFAAAYQTAADAYVGARASGAAR